MPHKAKTSDLRHTAKTVLAKLEAVRRSLNAAEREFAAPFLTPVIKEMRSAAKYSPRQCERLILRSVEQCGAVTITEIGEDTKLSKLRVKEIVKLLIDRNLLYVVRRTVIGSGMPQYAIKSRRVPTAEADIAFARPMIRSM